jgi:D-glycero-alpha-D-manno-heptose-7-phosphate kinase
MIITRAPVRISLAGGGTDLEAYYNRYGGMVISTTIDKYFYVFINADRRDNIQITSSDYRTFYRTQPGEPGLWEGDLALPRAVLDLFGIRRGISMFLASEVPPGTGLGSSSAVTVAVSKGVAALCGGSLSRSELAELACCVEIEKMGMPIGKQDQYAAAFGGLNQYIFNGDGVKVHPLHLSAQALGHLESNLLLFYTGAAHDSAAILNEQRRSSQQGDPQVIEALHAVKTMAVEVKACLEQGDLRRFGRLLDQNWQYKKRFAPGITNPLIDECYDLALRHGALGGKITGAGGGGFLMLACEEPDQARVTQVLEEKGFRRMDFRFENMGAQILVNAGLKIREA